MTDQTISDAAGGAAAPSPFSGWGAPPEAAGPSRPGAPAPAEYGATLADASGPGSRGDGSGGHSGFGARPAGGAAAYEMIRPIGAGGMGSVWLARDPRTGRHVAIKRLTEKLAGDPRLQARFLTEARTIASLLHIHIVALHTMDEDAQGPYLVMEYVAGPKAASSGPLGEWPAHLPSPPLDLDRRVREDGVLTPEHAAALGSKLCSALAYAHEHGVIHRDVKPANILLTDHEEPKLTDFGLARNDAAVDEKMTLAGAQLLSLGYGPPEQEIDASKADHRADLYALGGTVWFALTGENPRFYRESEVPASLRPVLNKALEKDRERRFQSAKEFQAALDRATGTGGAAAAEPVARGGAPVAGTCTHCGHRHLVDPANPLKRKFCESCGATLIEKCLACDAPNGVWSKFCGTCGADVEAAAGRAVDACQAQKDQYLSLMAASDFDPAMEVLERLKQLDHPRLGAFADFARESTAEFHERRDAGRADRDAKLRDARRRLEASDYPAAISLLGGVPAPLHTAAVRETLADARARLAESNDLRARLRAWVAARAHDSASYATARTDVMRLLQLQPSDPGGGKLLKHIEAWEAKQQEDCWRHSDGERTPESYAFYLHAYPDGTHADAARAMIERCEAEIEEAAWKSAQAKATLAGFRAYLTAHPVGAHAHEALSQTAPFLRALLQHRPRDSFLRRAYFQARTPVLRQMDRKASQTALAIGYGLLGLWSGTSLTTLLSAAGLGPVGGLVWGLAIGAAVAGVMAKVQVHVAVKQPASGWVIAGLVGFFALLFVVATQAQPPEGLNFWTSTCGLIGGAGSAALIGHLVGGRRTFSEFGPLPPWDYRLNVVQIEAYYGAADPGRVVPPPLPPPLPFA